uniref:Spermatogenesis-associated serine-rich protein 2-like n=1 Tax=Hippocampus comes TaxID=109280 RepID=A0A3Q2Y0B8_HIPCM
FISPSYPLFFYSLMDREVTLLAEMDKVKAEAMGILNARQKRAEELRRLTDQSASMSEEQLTELRADIKHFVSERKYDEDLGKAVRFTFDLEPLKTSITQFGSVYHPRTAYSDRSRCSSTSSSVASPSIVETPPPTQTQTPPSQFRLSPAKQVSYQSGGQRYNSGSNHDRKPGRPDYRYRDGGCPSNSSRGAPHAAASSSSSSSSASNQKPASHNGLPQRPPRMACP